VPVVRSSVRVLAVGACVAAAALVAGGCGTDERPHVRQALARFARAAASKDYRTLCERVLAPSVLQPLVQVGLPCEKALSHALRHVQEPRLVVRRIDVHGSTAVATVHTTAANQPPSDDVLQLVEVGNQWRVASLTSAPVPAIARRGHAIR
jgi:hypothetical protein